MVSYSMNQNNSGKKPSTAVCMKECLRDNIYSSNMRRDSEENGLQSQNNTTVAFFSANTVSMPGQAGENIYKGRTQTIVIWTDECDALNADDAELKRFLMELLKKLRAASEWVREFEMKKRNSLLSLSFKCHQDHEPAQYKAGALRVVMLE